jgi:cobalamin synthase
LAVVGSAALSLAAAVLARGTTGLVMAAAVAAATVCLGLIYRAWLGGATGDGLGAATEVGETLALVVAVALS